MQLSTRVLDVFTETPLAGNPLAVILDGSALTGAQMQAIAGEYNLSETVILLPPEDPSHAARLRIFTPSLELPFAGHPLVGTAVLLAELGEIFGTQLGSAFVLETGIGPLTCEIDATGALPKARISNDAPFQNIFEVPPEPVARCLSLPTEAVSTANHMPVMGSKGIPFVLTELADAAALQAAKPDAAAYAAAEASYPTGKAPFSTYAYVWTAPGEISARMFDPLIGIPEDPATGSAAAALGGLLADLSGAEERVTIHQGVDMGRPSRIEILANSDAPSGSLVQISGAAVIVMQGTLTI